MENYERLQEIGKGSYGSVYKIKRKSDGQILVWKELDYGRMSEREKQQVVSEVNILSSLNHPNIVKYYDKIIEKETKRIYIIMEHCENGDMAQLIKKCKQDKDYVAEDVIWKIFVQIILALKECHNRKEGKILHRDLKPGNVFFDIGNNVKLGDFGLSRILSQESQYAHTNVGTPYYMSPEQINEAQYNEKTDIWSCGCVLYEMVALRPPFEASNHLALAKKIIQGKIERIPERYSEDLQNVIERMLSTDPERRPSVDQLSDIQKIKLRMNEREMREEYTKLKKRDQELSLKTDQLKLREEQLQKREEELKEREMRAQELKLKISQSSGFKNNEIYSSIENQKAFEKMLMEDHIKENMNQIANQSQKFNKVMNQLHRGQSFKNFQLPQDNEEQLYQTRSQASVSEILSKARKGSNSSIQRGGIIVEEGLERTATQPIIDPHNKKKDSTNRLFGDVSIVSSIDVASSTQMLGTGKKLTLVQYSSTSNSATPQSKEPRILSENSQLASGIQTSMEFQKVPPFSLKQNMQRDVSLQKILQAKREESETSLKQQESLYKSNQEMNFSSNCNSQKPIQHPSSSSLKQSLPKKNIKVIPKDGNQPVVSNIFQQINAQIQNGCPPRVQSAISRDSSLKSSSQIPLQQNSQKNLHTSAQIATSLAERLAQKDMEQQQQHNGRSSNLLIQKRPSSSACNSLTRLGNTQKTSSQIQISSNTNQNSSQKLQKVIYNGAAY